MGTEGATKNDKRPIVSCVGVVKSDSKPQIPWEDTESQSRWAEQERKLRQGGTSFSPKPSDLGLGLALTCAGG